MQKCFLLSAQSIAVWHDGMMSLNYNECVGPLYESKVGHLMSCARLENGMTKFARKAAFFA